MILNFFPSFKKKMSEYWVSEFWDYLIYKSDKEFLLICVSSYMGFCLLVSLCDSLFLQEDRNSLISSLGVYFYNTLSLVLGIPLFLLYLIYCIVLIVLVLPRLHGIALLKYAWVILVPFGKYVQDDNTRLSSVEHEFMHFVWIFTGFLPLGIMHCIVALVYCVSLVGIPVGIKHWKLAINAFWPFDKSVSCHKVQDITSLQ